MWYTYQLKKISIWYFLWPHNSRAAFNGPPAELEILGLWTKPLFSFISGAGGRDCCQLVNLKIGTWPSQRPRESAGTLRQWLPESESDCQSRKLSQQLGVFPIQRPPPAAGLRAHSLLWSSGGTAAGTWKLGPRTGPLFKLPSLARGTAGGVMVANWSRQERDSVSKTPGPLLKEFQGKWHQSAGTLSQWLSVSVWVPGQPAG